MWKSYGRSWEAHLSQSQLCTEAEVEHSLKSNKRHEAPLEQFLLLSTSMVPTAAVSEHSHGSTGRDVGRTSPQQGRGANPASSCSRPASYLLACKCVLPRTSKCESSENPQAPSHPTAEKEQAFHTSRVYFQILSTLGAHDTFSELTWLMEFDSKLSKGIDLHPLTLGILEPTPKPTTPVKVFFIPCSQVGMAKPGSGASTFLPLGQRLLHFRGCSCTFEQQVGGTLNRRKRQWQELQSKSNTECKNTERHCDWGGKIVLDNDFGNKKKLVLLCLLT